ncbi:MAG: hypothetical protein K0R08_932 [Solimicrobium sp.]|jgi:uncharacterized integral membrane protein|nr:hypothetical protein [Solimicrobium sp.]
MKIISKIIMLLLFIIFFGFALNNTDNVTLHFFSGYEFPGPLVLMLLIFFIAGIIFGVFSMLPLLFRHRRDLAQQKKNLALREKELARLQNESSIPPPSDSI